MCSCGQSGSPAKVWTQSSHEKCCRSQRKNLISHYCPTVYRNDNVQQSEYVNMAHGTNIIKAIAVVKLVFCRFLPSFWNQCPSRHLKMNQAMSWWHFQLIQWEQKSHHQFAQTAEWERQSVKCWTTKDHQTNDQCVGEETSAHTLQVQRNISPLRGFTPPLWQIHTRVNHLLKCHSFTALMFVLLVSEHMITE